MLDVSTLFREPTDAERRLLRLLATLTPDGDFGWVDGVRVRVLDDGGMGSLQLAPHGALASDRTFGKKAAEYQFADVDGVEVLVTLNVDQDGLPLELDVWKTDFSPLIQIPETL